MSRRLEWLFDDDDEATPPSGEQTRGGLIDGRYQLVERLGAGAMGVVYRAEDIWLGRCVAIKVLAPNRETSVSSAELLRHEARSLAKVRHENIVQVYALGPHAGSFYVAMEFIAGESLEALLHRHAESGTRLEIGRAIEIISGIGHGLSSLHAHGLVHRDVKPSNIVLEEGTGRPVLVDFGLAAAPRERALAGGTPSYVAPEQALEDRLATGPSSDLYALACTAFELLTGRTPFEGQGTAQLLLAHLRKEAPLISTRRASLAPFDPIFRRALAKSPRERQSSCAELVEELRAAAERVSKRSGATAVTLPAPPVAVTKPLRVVLLEADEGLRRQIVRIVDRTLRATGDDVEIEHLLSAAELGAACLRDPPNVVVIDEDTTNGVSAALVRALGERIGEIEPSAEVLVLRKSFDDRPSAAGPNARVVELPKPLNTHVLASVLSKMAARVVEKRKRAL